MLARMKLKDIKKNSVRYDAADEQSKKLLSSIYVMKEGLKFDDLHPLTWPTFIKVSIEIENEKS